MNALTTYYSIESNPCIITQNSDCDTYQTDVVRTDDVQNDKAHYISWYDPSVASPPPFNPFSDCKPCPTYLYGKNPFDPRPCQYDGIEILEFWDNGNCDINLL